MRVAMYYNNRDVRLEELPVPQIGPGEVLVRIVASGICGSDVMEWYRIKRAPLVLGHEVTGTIETAGEGVNNFQVGDRVIVTHHVPCNTCRYCLAGNHTACDTLHTTTFDPGGFAEFVRVPAINVDRGMLRLPEEVSFEDGSFIEPLGCVVRGQRVARLQPGQSVLILGGGISGLLHLLLAKTLGAGRILVTDVQESRLKQAVDFGAEGVIDARKDVPAQVRQLNEGRLADLVIICTGALPAFKQALQAVERAGTVLFFAPTDPGVELPIPVNDFWRNSITLLPSYGAAPVDLAIALELIRAGRVPVGRMISHRLSLEKTGEGFRLVTEGRNSLKVVIEPNK